VRWAWLALLLAGTASAQDAGRGRAIVADRTRGLCLLCHQAPIAEERFHGDLAPSLAGVGARLSVAELRARMVDSRAINPESIMPAYGRSSGLSRVGAAWQGRSILSDAEIEDVVAWLATLRK
jgi:sulfur-oxidizing protein SoxX